MSSELMKVRCALVVFSEMDSQESLLSGVVFKHESVRRSKKKAFVNSDTESTFFFYSETDYSQTTVDERKPNRRVINGRDLYEYLIFLKQTEEGNWIAGAKYSYALKEFFLKVLEKLFSLEYYGFNLPKIRNAYNNGNTLKGALTITRISIDHFGDSSSYINKVTIRGSNVFRSKKLEEIEEVLIDGSADSIIWKSISLNHTTSLETNSFFIDRFGNIKTTVDLCDREKTNLLEVANYLVKLSTVQLACPLRRKQPDED